MGSPRLDRSKQAGKALRRREGDFLHILFPDRAVRALRAFMHRRRHRPHDGFGSHRDGRHKLG